MFPSPRAMDLSRDFFGKLRGLCLTLEKEAKQLEQALRGEDTDYEDESPIRVLSDLHCEIRTLKEEVNASFGRSCSEKQAIQDFMKASEILMQRNVSDLGKIRELFQKYGYKPQVKGSTEEKEEVKSSSRVKSEEGEAADGASLAACPEKPPVPPEPLRDPQLADFGLSQYAFSRPWSAGKGQHPRKVYQDNSKDRTPLRTQTPCSLPKTPKCRLKMDDYECATPKLEHFGISEHTMCMNEDYTMALLHKTAQTSNKIAKEDYHEVKVAEMTPRGIMITPVPKSKVSAENAADWMTSPMILVFCTPDVKISSSTQGTVFSRSPERNEAPLPNPTETPCLPKFETKWLKAEQIKQEEKIESVTKNDATDKQNTEDRIPFAVSADEYLKQLGDPSPPKIKPYDQLLSTPPPPEITRIPDDVLQILSKYNHKVDSKAKEMETKAENTTRSGSDFTDYCNKENRGYPGFFKTNI